MVQAAQAEAGGSRRHTTDRQELRAVNNDYMISLILLVSRLPFGERARVRLECVLGVWWHRQRPAPFGDE